MVLQQIASCLRYCKSSGDQHLERWPVSAGMVKTILHRINWMLSSEAAEDVEAYSNQRIMQNQSSCSNFSLSACWLQVMYYIQPALRYIPSWGRNIEQKGESMHLVLPEMYWHLMPAAFPVSI